MSGVFILTPVLLVGGTERHTQVLAQVLWEVCHGVAPASDGISTTRGEWNRARPAQVACAWAGLSNGPDLLEDCCEASRYKRVL